MDKLDELHRDLGFKRLSASWAKCEIALGLLSVAVGLLALGGSSRLIGDFGAAQEVAGIILFVLGGYLAMAGHRSHLYQSQNRLAAWLATQTKTRSGTRS